jgi:hypothetical protein
VGDATVCAREGCGKPVVHHPGGGERRLYCSTNCRQRACKERAKLAAKAAVLAAQSNGADPEPPAWTERGISWTMDRLESDETKAALKLPEI